MTTHLLYKIVQLRIRESLMYINCDSLSYIYVILQWFLLVTISDPEIPLDCECWNRQLSASYFHVGK